MGERKKTAEGPTGMATSGFHGKAPWWLLLITNCGVEGQAKIRSQFTRPHVSI